MFYLIYSTKLHKIKLTGANMVFSTNELMFKYKNYGDAKGKIRRLVKNGELIPIARGLYEDNKSINPAYLSPWIYGPSYLSFDYVLYLHDLIPERVHVYTSATYSKHKRKIYRNAFGTYSYRDVPKLAYPQDVSVKVEEPYSYLIATCEKALCDKLYTEKPVRNMKEFRYLLFEDLRIDQEGFWALNIEDLKELAPLYSSTNLDFLSKLIKGRVYD